MSSKRGLKSEDEEGFIRAFHDDVVETEQMYRVKIKVEIKVTSKKGQLRLSSSAWKDVGSPSERCVATFESEYPTAQAARLHAALYRAAVGIGAACGRAGLPYRHEDSDSTVD